MRIAGLLLFMTVSLNAVSYTISPDLNLPEADNGAGSGEENKDSASPSSIPCSIYAILGSGARVHGKVQFPETITFQHRKESISYTKTISPDEIREINIMQYHAIPMKTGPDGTLYHFEPSRIEIVLHNDQHFYPDSIPEAFLQFQIETDDGDTTLYTFFADTYQKESGWKEVPSTDAGYHTRNPHPASVRRIIFPEK